MCQQTATVYQNDHIQYLESSHKAYLRYHTYPCRMRIPVVATSQAAVPSVISTATKEYDKLCIHEDVNNISLFIINSDIPSVIDD